MRENECDRATARERDRERERERVREREKEGERARPVVGIAVDEVEYLPDPLEALALKAGADRRPPPPALHCRSPDSGGNRYKSRGLEKAI